MRTLQILRHTPPRSCGRVSSSAYLEWKIYHSQLWRFAEHQVTYAPDNSRPMSVIREQIQKESVERGPKKGDLIYQNSEFVTVVGWVNRNDGVVGCLNSKTYELDWFTDCESPRGRKRWNLP